VNNPIRSALGVAMALSALVTAPARADGHYVAGVEGIQGASVPPPGVYYLGYLVDYDGDSVRAPGGSTDLPGSNSIKVTAVANRVVWMTSNKVLGADYGIEAIVPLIRTRLDLGAVPLRDSRNGVGDIYVGPVVLGWHGAAWDAVVAAGEWFDTGSHDKPASAGKGYKSTMLTGGGTWYFDSARSMTGSALMRYEVNGHNDAGFKPGSQLTLEWGLGKGVGPVVLGLGGYEQWQVGSDSGTGATSDKMSRGAIGAEVIYPILSAGVFLKGAFYNEFQVDGGSGAQPKGNLFRVTVVKAF